MDARLISELELGTLPRGQIHTLALHLVDDSLGRPIRVPLLVARGGRPGPVCGLTAALHGNEINGIPVIHRLFRTLDTERLRGTVVAVLVANAPSFLAKRRTFVDGRDLNHLFPGVPDGTESEVYAYRLLHKVVRQFDLFMDLHTASTGRINSLYVRADMRDVQCARMAYLQRPEIILHSVTSDRTLRGAAMELGIPSITLEIANPQRFQPRYIEAAVRGARQVLGAARLTARKRYREGPAPLLCSDSSWFYTDQGGLLTVLPELRQQVEEGEVIAHMTDIYGRRVAEYRAPWAGVIIGRSVDPVARTGARIVHLGRLASEGDGFLPRPSGEPVTITPRAGVGDR